jgi:uncharacterized protein (DUF952 family)
LAGRGISLSEDKDCRSQPSASTNLDTLLAPNRRHKKDTCENITVQIYHLVPAGIWQQVRGDYRAASLATEGFIHCSFAGQVAASANRFYADSEDLLLVHIEPDRLTSPLKVEAATSGEGFPHVYGPISPSAIIKVEQLHRGPDMQWTFVP